jgi:hypothetical protein
MFKNVDVFVDRDEIIFGYQRTPSPLSYALARQDKISITFSLSDLERIQTASSKRSANKEFAFFFKRSVVQLKLFRGFLRRSEHIYMDSNG